MGRSTLTLVGVLVLATLPAGLALAQRPDPAAVTVKRVKPTRAELRQARTAYQRGSKHQAAAEYDEALAAYEQAYRLTGSTTLWFNIGQVHRLAGRREQAIEAYERYLEAEPEGRGAPEAQGHITALRGEIHADTEAAERKRAEGEAAVARKRAADLAEQRAAERREQAERRAIAAARAERRERRAARYRLAGWISAGSGAGLVLVGAVFHVQAKSKEDDIGAAETRWSRELDRAVEDGEAAERNAIVLYSLGGAAIAAGATLYLVGRYIQPRDTERAVVVAPIISDERVGLGASLSF